MQSSSTTPESSPSTSVTPITVEHQTLEICKVRFDDQCILIPDPVIHSRMPRLVKKSYSLPLWRRRSSPTSSPPLGEGNGTPASPEENHLIFTLPVPSFAKARSPTRGDLRHQPLVPCIVDQYHPHARRPRRPSLPTPYNPDLITVPLRQCCADCFHTIDECLKNGVEWQEKFSRGARRRRSASVDTGSHRLHHRRKVSESLPGFDAMVNVDEVDKMHGSRHTNVSSSLEPPTLDSLVIDQGEELTILPSLSRQRDPTSPVGKTFTEPLAPPIAEEEEEPMVLDSLTPEPSAMEQDVPGLKASPETPHKYPRSAVPESTFSPPPLVMSPPSQYTSSPELPRTPPPSNPIPIPNSTSAHAKYASSSPEMNFLTQSPDLSFSLPSPNLRRRRSSPSSPEIPRSPTAGKKKAHMHLPTAGSFIKASVEMLKGVSSISGTLAV